MEKLKRVMQIGSLNTKSLAVALKSAVVVMAPIALFFQDLFIVFNDAVRNNATNYILAVPFLLLYLIYRKRKMIKASITLKSPELSEGVPLDDVIGALLFLISFLIYWYGSYTFTPLEIHMFTLPIFTSACILILFNMQTFRQLLFQIFFLLLLVPPPTEILYSLGASLSVTSSEIAYHIMAILGFPVTLTFQQGTPVIEVIQQNGSPIRMAVDIACSGIYSLIGFLVFALFMSYITRDKNWKKPIVFLLGFPLIYLLNAFRIFIIAVIGYYWGENLALYTFHLLGGWMLIFMGTLLLLITSDKILRIQIISSRTGECPECGKTPVTDYDFCHTCGRIQNVLWKRINRKDMAKVLVVAVAVILILVIQTPVLALTEGPPEVIVQTAKGEEVTTGILPEMSEYTLEYVYRDIEFEELAGQDASLVYAYFPDNYTEYTIWTTVEISATKSSLHRWETCLITWPVKQGYQPWVIPIEQEDVELLENPPIIGRYFIFQRKKSNMTQAVLYWYETSIFQANSTSQTKHVKISLVVYPDSLEDIPTLKKKLLELAKAVTGHWQPIKRWAPIALMISKNGDRLALTTIAILCGTFPIYALQRRKERRLSETAYRKLPKDHQKIVKAIHETEKKKLPTLANISHTYWKMTDDKIDRETILKNIHQIEEIGIIKKGIANREDEPVQIWKTQFYSISR